jgi:hypothetical protein
LSGTDCSIEALSEYRRGNFQAALSKLRTTARYEKGDEAVEAFRKILDYPGQITYFFRETPVSSWIEIPVAQVGLARAKTISGDIEGAREAYEKFFEMWKDADEDIPLLVEVNAEYKKLTTDN